LIISLYISQTLHTLIYTLKILRLRTAFLNNSPSLIMNT
jgi:hypothetical protein